MDGKNKKSMRLACQKLPKINAVPIVGANKKKLEILLARSRWIQMLNSNMSYYE